MELSSPPRLIADISIYPLDTTSPEKLYVAYLPDGRRLQISDYLYRTLSLIDGERSISEIAVELSRQFGKTISDDAVRRIFERKLVPAGLLVSCEGAPVEEDGSASRSPLSILFRLPLLSGKQMDIFTRPAQILFFWPVAIIVLGAMAYVHVLAYIQLDSIVRDFDLRQISPDTYLLIMALAPVGTLLHEFGHATACRRWRCRYGPMGIGIYAAFPVFYVDVTDSWRLPRMQRLVIDVGGMYFQLFIVILLYLWFHITPQEKFLIAIVVTDLTIARNLNPMFKFDGYWALSDLLGVPNLHKRVGEYLQGVILTVFGKRDAASNSFFSTSNRVTKGLLWVYTLACTLYFAYLGWVLLRFAPGFIRTYPLTLSENLQKIPADVRAGNISQALTTAFNVFVPTIMIIGLLLMLKRLLNLGYDAWHRWRSATFDPRPV